MFEDIRKGDLFAGRISYRQVGFGLERELILANLDFLYQQGTSIILRCPLVPEINDAPAHLEGIAALAAKYPHLLALN